MIKPIDDKYGVPLLGEELREFRALQRLLDEMEDEGLIVSKFYPDGFLRRGLTEKGRAERNKIFLNAVADTD
jgi:hypothetical protein